MMTRLTYSAGWLTVILLFVACDPPWQGPPDYDAIFPRDRVSKWSISVEPEDWLRLIVDPHSLPCQEGNLGPDCSGDTECPATCRCEPDDRGAGMCVVHYVPADVEIDAARYESVGIRLLGSGHGRKRNLRIRFNAFVPGQRFHGIKRINIRDNSGDPSMLREALSLSLMDGAKIPAPRFGFAWVSINGGLGGLYTMVEQVDRKFLLRCFGENRGNLYRIERGGNLLYRGDDPRDYAGGAFASFASRYERKTNELDPDVGDLIQLMKTLAESQGESAAESITAILDVDGFLRLLAVNTWLANMDSYQGTADNLYLYHDSSGRFRAIPWDLNRAFGNYHGASCALTTDDSIALDPDAPTCGSPRPLVDRVLAIDGWRQRYHEIFQEIIDGALRPDAVLIEMERMRAVVTDHAHQDIQTEFSAEDFETSFVEDVPAGDNPVRVPGLQPFVEERDRIIRARLGGT